MITITTTQAKKLQTYLKGMEDHLAMANSFKEKAGLLIEEIGGLYPRPSKGKRDEVVSNALAKRQSAFKKKLQKGTNN
ncbi:hypothetical protein [Rhizosphaericola mali]|uniref:Uncharacterized protein n=1 Tax=Rhizosphaericola mali TaxID=2545455 RepID=A0A5P2G4S6_9BACT|nr:hypothetical protein [Rhizosphaericola mali]QES88822.1 hypothetical protein E0W69_009205 [Rhizosphaericola mali]